MFWPLHAKFLTSYILYLLLITVREPALGLTLDINKEKYTKLSVVLFFSCCFEGCEFPPSLFCSVVSLLCRKPVVWIFSTNYARCYCSQFGGVVCFRCFLFCYYFCNCARGFYYSGYAVMSCDFWGML